MKMSNVYALNVAIANAICTGRLFSSPKEGFTKQILLDSDRKLMGIFKWKEKRGLDIKRMYFSAIRKTFLDERTCFSLFPF